MTATQNSGLIDRLLDILSAFAGATAVAAAVRVGHTPDPRDLRAIGIRPEDFSRIGRF